MVGLQCTPYPPEIPVDFLAMFCYHGNTDSRGGGGGRGVAGQAMSIATGSSM